MHVGWGAILKGGSRTRDMEEDMLIKNVNRISYMYADKEKPHHLARVHLGVIELGGSSSYIIVQLDFYCHANLTLHQNSPQHDSLAGSNEI